MIRSALLGHFCFQRKKNKNCSEFRSFSTDGTNQHSRLLHSFLFQQQCFVLFTKHLTILISTFQSGRFGDFSHSHKKKQQSIHFSCVRVPAFGQRSMKSTFQLFSAIKRPLLRSIFNVRKWFNTNYFPLFWHIFRVSFWIQFHFIWKPLGRTQFS